jgi:hypothetical protein
VGDFLFVRSQMALSLAFHIIFAATGIGMPLLMVISEGLVLAWLPPSRQENVIISVADIQRLEEDVV